MIKRFGYIIIAFFIGFSAQAQEEADSVLENNFVSIVRSLEAENLDSANYYKDVMVNWQLEKGEPKLSKLYFHLGALFQQYFYYKEAEELLDLGIAHADTINRGMDLEDLHNQKGLIYYDNERYTLALHEFKEALEIAYLINDTLGIAIVNNNVGLIYLETEDYQHALTFFNKALEYAVNDDAFHLKQTAINNIAIIYYQQNQFHKSLELLKEAEQAILEKKCAGLDNVYLNMGLNYNDIGEYQKATEKLKSARELYYDARNYQKVFMCDVNLYLSAYRSGDVDLTKEMEQKALSGADTLNSLKVKLDLYTYLTDAYLAEGDTVTSYKYQTKLLEVGDQLMENYKDEQLLELKGDVNYSRVSNELTDVQSSYQQVKKEKDEFAIINEQLSIRNKWIIFLGIAFLLVAISFIAFLLKANKKQKESNLILKTQKEQLNIQNTQILNSAEYASSMEKMLLQQMNPHFIFNALTTIEASVSVGDYDFSKEYISMFATLLRKTLDYSRSEAISLVDEISFLKAYIELNKVKQGEDFEYEFIYDEDHVEDFVNTPPMLVQPFVENALIHGLYHKTNGVKTLSIAIEPHDEYILWTIIDNGVGRVKSKEIGKTHKGISHGIKITSDRIKWMKNIYGHQFSIEYTDLDEGTRVVLKTPIVEV